MNGAEAFVETLVQSGIRKFFGLPGSTEAPLLEAIRATDDLDYVLSLHESATVAMADGYARLTGTPGVVGLHTTVGTMNGMSQLFNAYRDRSPVVLTAGHKDRTVLAEDGFCASPDLASMLRSFTKSSWQSLDARLIGADLRRALQSAMTPPEGPTFLALPEDLMAESVDDSTVASLGVADLRTAANPTAIEAACDALCAARAPLLVVGSGAAGAGAEVLALAQAFELPMVFTDFSDLGTLPYLATEERHLGLYGEDRALLQHTDLVVAVGNRVFYPFSDATRSHLPAGARLVHVSDDPGQVNKVSVADVGVIGDPALVCGQLVAALSDRGELPSEARATRRDAWRVAAAARRAAIARELEEAPSSLPLALTRFGAELNRVLPDGVVLVDEGVRSSRHLLRYLAPPPGSTVLRTTGGSLGWGVPAAIGAKIAAPGRPVVALVGDGSFQFSVQAVWTAAMQGADVVVVVLDNGGYLAVKRAVEGFLGVPRDTRVHPGTEITDIDHVAVARGYGADGVDVARPGDLAEAVKDGLGRGGVYVVRAPVVAIRP